MPLTKGQILKEIDDWLGEMDNCLLVINGLLYNIWANARRIEHGVDEVETAGSNPALPVQPTTALNEKQGS